MRTRIEKAKQFWRDEDGIGTLEMIMIVAVIVIIAIAFRKWIMKWVGELFTSTDEGITDFKKTDNPNLNPPTS